MRLIPALISLSAMFTILNPDEQRCFEIELYELQLRILNHLSTLTSFSYCLQAGDNIPGRAGLQLFQENAPITSTLSVLKQAGGIHTTHTSATVSYGDGHNSCYTIYT
jgi:hypothetical protein